MPHPQEVASNRATIALTFSSANHAGEKALVSKDLSGPSPGHFQLLVIDGVIWVELEHGDSNKWLKVPNTVLSANVDYHVAVSFGNDGIAVYLDGQLAAAEPTIKQGLGGNTEDLNIGGSRSHRSDPNADPHSLFVGTISDVQVYGRQLSEAQVGALASEAGIMDGAKALSHASLAPVLEQMHHGSEWLAQIAHDYGLGGHGHMGGMSHMGAGGIDGLAGLNIVEGRGADNSMNGTSGRDGLNGMGGNDTLYGWRGDDVLQGGQGADSLFGGKGDDVLDGGAGEDVLRGGGGNDWLISRADAREPEVADIPGRDEGDPYNELTDGKLYPDQPMPANDVLEGGFGADTFYFQTLINAKAHFIEKHTNDAGVINWHGVAGENDNIHDHWVDALGDDIILDYSVAQGDQIVIEGHTTYISGIVYGDHNGDGVLDHSVISLYSDQGRNGGAHHLDELGTITVFGDLVKESDILTDAGPAYGIVHDIAELDRAVTPPAAAEAQNPILAPDAVVTADRLMINGTHGPVVAAPGEQVFDASRSAIVIEPGMADTVRNGTISFSFSVDALEWQALFSKDASGLPGRSGHMSLYVEEDGDLVFRVQDSDSSHHLVASGVIEAGQVYDVSVTWGRWGASLWLDGMRVARDAEADVNMARNDEFLVIGATGWSSTPGTADKISGHMEGSITDFSMYNFLVNPDDLVSHSAREGVIELSGASTAHRLQMVDGTLAFVRNGREWLIDEQVRYVSFNDADFAASDIHRGTMRANDFSGGSGSDYYEGRGGADILRGYDNHDVLLGGADNDSLYGGDGDDILEGGVDDDYLDGGDQNDRIFGESGHDNLRGGSGDDTLVGGLGDDDIYGHSWSTEGSDTDFAVFNGNRADYVISGETFWNGSRDSLVERVIVEDNASGGLDGYYEGRDRLVDVEILQFADGNVAIADLNLF